MALHALVHTGLGVAGVVPFVVAVLPVAEHVDEDVGVEAVAVLHGQLGYVVDRLGVVSVDVKHGGLDHRSHSAGVDAGSGILVVGSEPDLVVDDEVDGSPGGVGLQSAHLGGFEHNALTGHRRIAVHEDRNDLIVIVGVQQIRFGPCKALYDRVDGLQVAGVRRQFDVYRTAHPRIDQGAVAHMVLHVAVSLNVIGDDPFELLEDALIGFTHDISQHVQPAAVGHPDDYLLYAIPGGFGDDRIQPDDSGLPALQTEALLGGVLDL